MRGNGSRVARTRCSKTGGDRKEYSLGYAFADDYRAQPLAIGANVSVHATDLFTRLGQHGFSADQLQAFLPRVLEFFRTKLPPDVLEKVEGLMPGLPEVAAPSGP